MYCCFPLTCSLSWCYSDCLEGVSRGYRKGFLRFWCRYYFIIIIFIDRPFRHPWWGAPSWYRLLFEPDFSKIKRVGNTSGHGSGFFLHVSWAGGLIDHLWVPIWIKNLTLLQSGAWHLLEWILRLPWWAEFDGVPGHYSRYYQAKTCCRPSVSIWCASKSILHAIARRQYLWVGLFFILWWSQRWLLRSLCLRVPSCLLDRWCESASSRKGGLFTWRGFWFYKGYPFLQWYFRLPSAFAIERLFFADISFYLFK